METELHLTRRAFDHLYAEICVAAGRRLSRYDVWLCVWETGGDPEHLGVEGLQAFLDDGLDGVLQEEGLALSERSRRRLTRSVLTFDPRHPTPEEWLAGTIQGGAA